MRTFIPLMSLLIIFSACNRKVVENSAIAPDNPNIVYTGRFDFSDPAKPVFMYSGCTIGIDFTGTSISVIMKDDSLRNYFTIALDDTSFVLHTNRADSTYVLATGLSNRLHHLEVSRRTEWHGGNTTFLGFKVDPGASVQKPQVPTRKLEFIGDSYTCGYGNEGAAPTEDFKYETENNTLSYGAMTSRTLNAQYLAVCRSGIGIIHGYGGVKGFTMPRYYNTVTNDSTKNWDFTRYIPDAVVIVLGGNDLSVALDSAAFVMEYIRFVERVCMHYPDAHIICVAGPSDAGKKFIKWKNMIHAIVTESRKNNPRVHYFEFSPFSMHGSDYHPNIAEHQNMAVEMTEYLKELLNW